MLAWSVQNVRCNFMSRESLAIYRNGGMVQTDIHDSVALLNTIFFTKPWHDTDDKEISHPKTEICWKFIQAMPDVDEFVSSSEQIWRNVALHHLFTSGSSTVNGCRQNEKHENITIIHTSPVHKWMPCEVKSCMLVRKISLLIQTRWPFHWWKQYYGLCYK